MSNLLKVLFNYFFFLLHSWVDWIKSGGGTAAVCTLFFFFPPALNWCLCVLLQPQQITRRRWLRFLPFWLSGFHPVIRRRLLILPEGSILPVPRAQDCSFHPAPPPPPHRSGLHGAHDGGGLQLPLRQQLCPLLPSHAALHERTSAHLRGS